MQLNNITIQCVITLPFIDVDKELGLENARKQILHEAVAVLIADPDAFSKLSIIDCPDYPAICF